MIDIKSVKVGDKVTIQETTSGTVLAIDPQAIRIGNPNDLLQRGRMFWSDAQNVELVSHVPRAPQVGDVLTRVEVDAASWFDFDTIVYTGSRGNWQPMIRHNGRWKCVPGTNYLGPHRELAHGGFRADETFRVLHVRETR